MPLQSSRMELFLFPRQRATLVVGAIQVIIMASQLKGLNFDERNCSTQMMILSILREKLENIVKYLNKKRIL